RLEPLRREHAAELFSVAHDDDIWRLFLVPMPRDVVELERWIAAALEEQTLGNQVAFITRRMSDGAPIGSTRFLHIDRANKTAASAPASCTGSRAAIGHQFVRA